MANTQKEHQKNVCIFFCPCPFLYYKQTSQLQNPLCWMHCPPPNTFPQRGHPRLEGETCYHLHLRKSVKPLRNNYHTNSLGVLNSSRWYFLMTRFIKIISDKLWYVGLWFPGMFCIVFPLDFVEFFPLLYHFLKNCWKNSFLKSRFCAIVLPSTTNILSLSIFVLRKFSLVDCWLFKLSKLSLDSWSGHITGDLWLWCWGQGGWCSLLWF